MHTIIISAHNKGMNIISDPLIGKVLNLYLCLFLILISRHVKDTAGATTFHRMTLWD